MNTLLISGILKVFFFFFRTTCTQNAETHLLYNWVVMDRAHNRRIVQSAQGCLRMTLKLDPLVCVVVVLGLCQCLHQRNRP